MNTVPLKWRGTVEDRLARLDESKRRCDGNNRRCFHAATTVYTLAPAKESAPIEGSEQVTKQSCSKHARQFVDNPNYVVVEVRQLPGRPAGKAHPHTIY